MDCSFLIKVGASLTAVVDVADSEMLSLLDSEATSGVLKLNVPFGCDFAERYFISDFQTYLNSLNNY